ncbi:MAG: hypothetical protein LBN10_09320 [Propionibacteriaceae bacterium]|nr:hypothetical protein [Propionibacteriaceae bacterium]
MSVPPSGQDGSVPEQFPDFLPPGGFVPLDPSWGSQPDGSMYNPLAGDNSGSYSPGQPPLYQPIQQLGSYPPAQPTAAYQAYSPNPQPQQPRSYYSQNQSTYPAATPKAGSTTKTVGVVVLVVAVIIAGGVLWATLGPKDPLASQYTPPQTNPTPAGPTWHNPGPELPIVLEPAPVVEAIDVPDEPTLGEPWNATDGIPADEGLEAAPVVTPCGVLVTFLMPSWDSREDFGKAPKQADQSRIAGYDIASGKQLWSVDFQDATGQMDPDLDYRFEPTYTPDCRMLVTSSEEAYEESDRNHVSLVIDLDTGEVSSYYDERIEYCQTVDNDWAVCWGYDAIRTLDLADFTRLPQREDPLSYRDLSTDYLEVGEATISGLVWSPQGYRDPSSGDIVFGADSHAGAMYSDDDPPEWVVYVEPLRPGGYRSGLVLRVEGSLFMGDGQCQIMLWDTSGDKALWDSPGEFACGRNTFGDLEWIATQTTLLIYSEGYEDQLLTAYALSDGHFIWEQSGWLTGGSSRYLNNAYVEGITNEYASFYEFDSSREIVRRVSDGADFAMVSGRATALSATMAYSSDYSSRSFRLAAYVIDPAQPAITPKMAWSVPVADEYLEWWTFATNGTMYVATRGDNDEILVRPLIP